MRLRGKTQGQAVRRFTERGGDKNPMTQEGAEILALAGLGLQQREDAECHCHVCSFGTLCESGRVGH